MNPQLEVFDRWWPRVRDVAAFGVGITILLFKANVDVTQEMIGAACIGVSVSHVTRRIIERNGRNGKRRPEK